MMITGASTAAAAFMLPSALRASRRQDAPSGGLGLTMTDIEAMYGPGQPGQSFMVYTDPMYGVDLHIGHENEIVDYVWLSLGNEQEWTGTLLDDAWDLINSLLPEDARLRENYAMQETPGSLGSVEIVRLTSRWLDEVLDGRAAILVSVTSYPLEQGQVAMRGWIAVEQR
jgi:hypothetical protein